MNVFHYRNSRFWNTIFADLQQIVMQRNVLQQTNHFDIFLPEINILSTWAHWYPLDSSNHGSDSAKHPKWFSDNQIHCVINCDWNSKTGNTYLGLIDFNFHWIFHKIINLMIRNPMGFGKEFIFRRIRAHIYSILCFDLLNKYRGKRSSISQLFQWKTSIKWLYLLWAVLAWMESM